MGGEGDGEGEGVFDMDAGDVNCHVQRGQTDSLMKEAKVRGAVVSTALPPPSRLLFFV